MLGWRQLDMRMQHLAIIMDGNRRWAKSQGLSALAGHQQGADSLQTIARAVAKRDIPYLTVFAFSSENWKRSPMEVSGLMTLMRRFLMREIDALVSENVRLRIIGDWSRFDSDMVGLFEQAEAKTRDNSGLILSVCLNYSGQNDILQATEAYARAHAATGGTDDKALSPDGFKAYLMTAHLPPVDLLIRTGNEYRISNFLLWDSAYAELYFSAKNWPDFDAHDLDLALSDFNARQRRFGGDAVEAVTFLNQDNRKNG